MTRREIRENVFKLLFRVEFHNEEEMNEQLDLLKEELQGASDKDLEYISEKCKGLFTHLEEVDKAIDEVSKGWKTSRMAKVDLTIIRLAVYEIKYEDDIPVKVSINEAVELAKMFGTDESKSFVNGVLAKFVC